MQHAGLRDDLILFCLINISCQCRNEQRREDRQNDQHDDQLHEREAAFFVLGVQHLEKFLLPDCGIKFGFLSILENMQ